VKGTADEAGTRGSVKINSLKEKNIPQKRCFENNLYFLKQNREFRTGPGPLVNALGH
jgi:hypothetical protein